MIHRQLVLPVAAALVLTAFAPVSAPAQPAPGKPLDARSQAIADLVLADHILADQGVVDGFGHVSVRDPADPSKFFLARSMAPELVTAADVFEHDLDGNAPAAGTAKLYLERFLHAEIYRARPDVIAVVHCHAPDLIPFGVTSVALRPIYHMSSFLGGGVPVFDIHKATGASTDMLISSPELGKALAGSLASHPVALLRGHGAVIVGKDLPAVVFRAVYTELNAKLQAQAMTLGAKITFLDPDEAKKSEQTNSSVIGRSWELWVRKVGGK